MLVEPVEDCPVRRRQKILGQHIVDHADRRRGQ
jgi:hypothetical protein